MKSMRIASLRRFSIGNEDCVMFSARSTFADQGPSKALKPSSPQGVSMAGLYSRLSPSISTAGISMLSIVT